MTARQVAAFGRPTDIAVALSTSGNSENLLRGLTEAGRRGMLTVGIAGYQGGQMAELDGLAQRRVHQGGARVHQLLDRLLGQEALLQFLVRVAEEFPPGGRLCLRAQLRGQAREQRPGDVGCGDGGHRMGQGCLAGAHRQFGLPAAPRVSTS